MAELNVCHLRKLSRLLYLGLLSPDSTLNQLHREELSYICALANEGDDVQAQRKRFRSLEFFDSPTLPVKYESPYQDWLDDLRVLQHHPFKRFM